MSEESSDENAMVRAVLSAPDDDAPRLILADWYEDRGRDCLAADLRREPVTIGRLPILEGDGGYGDGGDGDGYGDGGDGGYGGYGGGGYGDGDGGYGDGYVGDGYGGGYGDGYVGGGYSYSEVRDMQDGLYVLTTTGGYNPYVLVGWVEVRGLDVIVRNARVIRFFGNSQAIAGLASKGPAVDTQLLVASKEEILWRPNIGRAIPANVKAWKKECPQPPAPAGVE